MLERLDKLYQSRLSLWTKNESRSCLQSSERISISIRIIAASMPASLLQQRVHLPLLHSHSSIQPHPSYPSAAQHHRPAVSCNPASYSICHCNSVSFSISFSATRHHSAFFSLQLSINQYHRHCNSVSFSITLLATVHHSVPLSLQLSIIQHLCPWNSASFSIFVTATASFSISASATHNNSASLPLKLSINLYLYHCSPASSPHLYGCSRNTDTHRRFPAYPGARL